MLHKRCEKPCNQSEQKTLLNNKKNRSPPTYFSCNLCSLTCALVTTPYPTCPAPLSAQNSSSCSCGDATIRWPAGVTTSIWRQLSTASPCVLLRNPNPPPNVKPMMPTSVQEPFTAASPWGQVTSSRSFTVTPASTQAVAAPLSTSMFFIADISRTRPSRIMARPEH